MSGEVWTLEQPVSSRSASPLSVPVIAAGGDVATAENSSEALMASGISQSSAGADAGGIGGSSVGSSNGSSSSSSSSHDNESPASSVHAVGLSSNPTLSRRTMATPAESEAASPQAPVTDTHSSSDTPHGNEAGEGDAVGVSASEIGVQVQQWSRKPLWKKQTGRGRGRGGVTGVC